jgi:hypothetical protein
MHKAPCAPALAHACTASGVQLRLWWVCRCLPGTVLKLGTEKHHQGLLRGIDNMTEVGCFALTELGFGECWARQRYTAYSAQTVMPRTGVFSHYSCRQATTAAQMLCDNLAPLVILCMPPGAEASNIRWCSTICAAAEMWQPSYHGYFLSAPVWAACWHALLLACSRQVTCWCCCHSCCCCWVSPRQQCCGDADHSAL